jgi:hypothetical protein
MVMRVQLRFYVRRKSLVIRYWVLVHIVFTMYQMREMLQHK